MVCISNFIKSPLNYVGGKFKLLPQIIPLFPDSINTFIDLFAGGCNVGVNVNANRILLNDTQEEVINLVKYLYENDVNTLIEELEGIMDKFSLNAWEKEPYLALRDAYNNGDKSEMMFYALVVHSFSNQIRFNRHGKFNMPVGKRTFNPQLRKRFITFVDVIKQKNLTFSTCDFATLKSSKLNEDDFVYCDPPYLVTTAAYNEQGGWSEEHEFKLFNLLDELNENDIKFALSNVFENKGKKNDILIEWSRKYKIHYLNNTYSNCNYQAKDKSKNSTVEVLVTNY
ncbi:Dam family site-specific DNA-(adenine-N6)-methyltransferase [Bacillus sp. Bva_UNVM-123]|uniref:DNA adenine methylase n=1 Tax=Bacillus sp. Bva_UNVM-123 TaxID=2829798 RepID=UPI00391EF010